MKRIAITMLADAGLLAGCNQSVENASADFNKLPAEVQKTVRAQAPNSEIVNVSSTKDNGVDVFEIKFKNPDGSTPKVTVAADGRLVSSDFPRQPGAIEKMLTPTGATGTKFSALPEAVQKTIQSKAPNAEIADISRHEKNGMVYYTVEFRDQGKNPTMQVSDDGRLIQDLQK